MKIKPIEPNPITFKRTIKDPHIKRNKIVNIGLSCLTSFGLGFGVGRLTCDKFQRGKTC